MRLLIVMFAVTTCIALESVVGQTSDHNYRPRVVVPRSLPAITEIPFAGAKQSNLDDDELVIGVVVNGQSRAYPINQLTGPRREILNDELGGVAIAATW